MILSHGCLPIPPLGRIKDILATNYQTAAFPEIRVGHCGICLFPIKPISYMSVPIGHGNCYYTFSIAGVFISRVKITRREHSLYIPRALCGLLQQFPCRSLFVGLPTGEWSTQYHGVLAFFNAMDPGLSASPNGSFKHYMCF